MAWLLGWNYRKSKTVNGTTFGSQTNYTLQLNVFKGSGIDTNTEVYLDNNCNDDFSDIRFTSSDGVTLLDYYIESMTAGVSAIIYIEIDYIPIGPGSTNIYVYYGNLTATSLSNADNTFSLYYNGTDTVLTDKWQVLTGSANYSSIPGRLYMYPSTVVVAKNPLPINFELIYHDTSNCNESFPTIHDIKLTKETTQRNISRLYSTIVVSAICEEPVAYTPVLEGVTKPNIADTLSPPHIIVTHILGVGWTMSMASSVSQPSLRNLSDTLYLHFATPALSDGDTNYVRVRKLASPEPTFGTAGVEETTLGDVCIKSNPSGASITIDGIIQPGKTTAMSGTPCTIDNTVIGLTPGTNNHSYGIALIGYQPVTNLFGIVAGMVTEIDIGNLTPSPCPVSPKYEGNTVTLNATPKDGTGPYYVVFKKGTDIINPLRLGGLPNPILSAPENTLITRVYTLDDLDISSASTGTIDFSVYIIDSCPTGAKSCTGVCTITIGCIAPVCNFAVI